MTHRRGGFVALCLSFFIFSGTGALGDEPVAFKPSLGAGVAWNLRSNEPMAWAGATAITGWDQVLDLGVGYYAGTTTRLPGVTVGVNLGALTKKIGGDLTWHLPFEINAGFGAAFDWDAPSSVEFLNRWHGLLTGRVLTIKFKI